RPRSCRDLPSFPTRRSSDLAHSDLAAFLSGINRTGDRWRMHMTRSPAGSLHEVEMVFNDPIITNAIGDGAGIDLPGGGQLSLSRSEEHTSELQSRENLVCRL